MKTLFQIIRSVTSLYVSMLRFFITNVRLRISWPAKLLSAFGGIVLMLVPCLLLLFGVQQIVRTFDARGRSLTAEPSTVQTLANPMPTDLVSAEVMRVVDGDTIEVALTGQRERVRFIGIDTPEVGRCFAHEATERTAQLVEDRVVLLEADLSQDDRDRYGRLLRYIWLSDGQMVNQLLVNEGYAFEYTFRVEYKYQALFQASERDAERNQRGLWSPATCDGNAGRR